MKKIIWILLLLPLSILAQKTHKVEPKESIYSIGRKYKVHPKELAEYNNLSLDEGVKIGQVLKIPSKKKMEPLEENTAESKSEKVETPKHVEEEVVKVAEKKSEKLKEGNPILHKVAKKETLYKISKENNVSVDDLKKWNHLKEDGVSVGTELIVGFEKGSSKNKETKGDENSEVKTQPKKENKKSVVKDEVVVKETEETTPAKTETQENQTQENQNPKATSPKKSTEENKNYQGGYFAKDYNLQIEDKSTPSEQKGTASTFKSTSGWDDGRYYCLTNASPSGTIVKVLNTSNQKFIYAKVLDVIPDLKQNEGVSIVISKAAAEQLSVTTDKFDVEMSY